MSKVISIGGKKGSGKNTIATFLSGITLTSFKVIPEFRVKGTKLLINEEEVDPNIIRPDLVKIYAFADSLKEVAINIFGLKPQQVYGTDFQKQTRTNLRWENMPGVISNKDQWDDLQKWHEERVEKLGKKEAGKLSNFMYHEPGYMSGREVLQFTGTEVFRKMYKRCWTYALEKRIKEENPVFAIISDMRFDNELRFVHDNLNATSIYLTRSLHEDDHPSENGFSSLTPFSVIINNDDGNLRNLFKETIEKLNPLKVLAPIS